MDNFFGELDNNGNLVLGKEELAHCTRVLRKKTGDTIGVLNGKRDSWTAVLTDSTFKTGIVSVQSHQKSENPLPYTFHLAVAPTKNSDRIEWLLEKAIETGIHQFTLIYTQRTERKRTNIERLEKIAVAALKQSGQVLLPEISEQKFRDFVTGCKAPAKFIASCKPFESIATLQSLSKQENLCVLVGPEGDFTDEEYEFALQHDFQPISLGSQRFRTETAALVAVMARFTLG